MNQFATFQERYSMMKTTKETSSLFIIKINTKQYFVIILFHLYTLETCFLKIKHFQISHNAYVYFKVLYQISVLIFNTHNKRNNKFVSRCFSCKSI